MATEKIVPNDNKFSISVGNKEVCEIKMIIIISN